MEIILGSDHAGFELKEACKSFLNQAGEHRLRDVGVFDRKSFDYPKIAHIVAQAVASGEFARGILVCGTGIGMSITANRYKRVRAALCLDLYSVRMARMHNDANILALGGRILGVGLAIEIVEVFLKTPFEGGRHQGRIEQMDR
jgi:ribose 5-phosphate isomerase B